MRLDCLLTQAATRYGDAPGFTDEEGTSLTWREMDRRADAFAAALRRQGGRPGERVLLVCRNDLAAVAALFGTLRAGLVAVPLDPETPQGRLRFVAENCRPVAACVIGAENDWKHPLGLPRIDPAPPVEDAPAPIREALNPEALALLVYTSGSTSHPKAVMAPHGAVLFAARAINGVLGNTRRDVILDVLPFAFDYGLYQIFLATEAGARLVLVPANLGVLALPELLARHQVTGLPATPTLLALLMRSRLLKRMALPTLRYVTSTGDVLPPTRLRGLQGLLPGVAIHPMYGLTECKRVSILPGGACKDFEGSVGLPLPGTSVEIVDEAGRSVSPGTVGELLVRGPHVMAGYWNDPEATARTFALAPDGTRQLLTGDRFHQDTHGYLYFHGRSQDFVKSGGYRLGLREIEAALAEVPGVAEVAVIGRPHDLLGTEVVALVVCIGKAEAVLAACRQNLPPPHGPRRYEAKTELPRTVHGKCDRARLLALLTTGGADHG